jgi:hypothetical protein
MGLDMYLTAHKYLYSDSDEEKGKEVAEILGINRTVRSVAFRAMQWRKCHMVNQWFIDRLDDRDVLQECEIDREVLAELINQCTRALEGKTSDFADNEVDEVDEDFKYEMQITKDGLEACLKDFPENFWFTYCASW